jgi:hypothetical protein
MTRTCEYFLLRQQVSPSAVPQNPRRPIFEFFGSGNSFGTPISSNPGSKYQHLLQVIRTPIAPISRMKQASLIQIDYNAEERDLPSRSALLGGKPLSPFAAAMAFLLGLGAIMGFVTLYLTGGN